MHAGWIARFVKWLLDRKRMGRARFVNEEARMRASATGWTPNLLRYGWTQHLQPHPSP
jgi:hypothetical protein